jgi:Zn finger protein HypA/HybF involved in hydrogenase expression
MSLRKFICVDCEKTFESVGMPIYCYKCHFNNYNPKTGKYDLKKESEYYQKLIRQKNPLGVKC